MVDGKARGYCHPRPCFASSSRHDLRPLWKASGKNKNTVPNTSQPWLPSIWRHNHSRQNVRSWARADAIPRHESGPNGDHGPADGLSRLMSPNPRPRPIVSEKMTPNGPRSHLLINPRNLSEGEQLLRRPRKTQGRALKGREAHSRTRRPLGVYG